MILQRSGEIVKKIAAESGKQLLKNNYEKNIIFILCLYNGFVL